MKVVLRKSYCTIWRDPNEQRVGDESQLLYQLKLMLNQRGYDFVKKLMWKDGHLVSDTQHYLRRRRPKPGRIRAIYDHLYAVRNSAQDYNNWQRVTFSVECES